MEKLKLGIAIVIACTPGVLCAQRAPSSYAGQEGREIKALSAEERDQYLTGQGMGLAKAAELNHYPGPKHVLELADSLQLSAEQKAKTQKIYDRMHAEAVRLGKLIVEKEAALDRLYAEQTINEAQLRARVLEIGQRQGELRLAHLRAHLEMKQVLSAEQIAKYNELRGYHAGGAHDAHSPPHKHHE